MQEVASEGVMRRDPPNLLQRNMQFRVLKKYLTHLSIKCAHLGAEAPEGALVVGLAHADEVGVGEERVARPLAVGRVGGGGGGRVAAVLRERDLVDEVVPQEELLVDAAEGQRLGAPLVGQEL